MHPILFPRRRLRLYLAAWIPLAAILVYLLARAGESWMAAAALTLPLCTVYAFLCLAAWYPCRATPLESAGFFKLLLTHFTAAVLISTIWVQLAKQLAIAITRWPDFAGVDVRSEKYVPLVFVAGVLLYVLSVTLHYVLLAEQASREAQGRALEAQVLARDAELKALRAQVNPHFLFNCLHSISALTSVDAGKAREMCILLADFLRTTLRVGGKEAITLEEELALIRGYLAIEKVRFGARVMMEEQVDSEALPLLLPPLLLQPLVENAIRHGIANLPEGGVIGLNVHRKAGAVAIVVENSFDPDTPSKLKTGLGLENVRRRLHARYGVRGQRFVWSGGQPFFREAALARAGEWGSEMTMAGEIAKIRVIVVDDEELARKVLLEFLAAHPEIEVVAECANGFEAVKAVGELKPDLIFLDIQMPKLDGFEVLELIGTDRAVVFVTAYDEYALRAFEIHAVDYLLKPFAADRLETAVQRVKQRLGGKLPAAAELAASARAPAQYLERLVVKDGTRVYVIPVAKLDYAEAQDDYVALSTEGKKHLKQQTISSLEAALDPQLFLRIHRSYIVNLEKVTKIEPYSKDQYVVVLAGGQQLPVSRSGYARLRAFLDQKK